MMIHRLWTLVAPQLSRQCLQGTIFSLCWLKYKGDSLRKQGKKEKAQGFILGPSRGQCRTTQKIVCLDLESSLQEHPLHFSPLLICLSGDY